jgi:hypothetical protein
MKNVHRRNAPRKAKNAELVERKDNATGLPDYNQSGDIFGGSSLGTSGLSIPAELAISNAYMPLTLNRILLSYSYMTHGVIQTAIDQPVEDAFRGGLDLKSDELDAEDMKLLQDYLEQCGVLKAVKDTMRWAKLYGGAGLIINTAQDPATKLDLNRINSDLPLSFIAADRWELVLQYIGGEGGDTPYNYYGQPLHSTRVLKVMGKEAPSFVRKRLQGWGMSELERMIRSLNSWVKNEEVIYALLDEAKIDIWKINGFNNQLLSQLAAGKLTKRLEIATMLKNFQNAIVMDKEDEYDQKQISFSGLHEILNQNRIGAAAAVRMPMTKLFGLSAAGFNSGEDDIENYNSLIESEVRAKAKEILQSVLPLCCLQLFGFMPSLEIGFHPLRVLSAEQEEQIKTSKQNRFVQLKNMDMLTPIEFMDALKQEKLFTMETEVGQGLREPEPPIQEPMDSPGFKGTAAGTESGEPAKKEKAPPEIKNAEPRFNWKNRRDKKN